MDDLSFLEDVEITGAHIYCLYQLQGGASSGGCDASHWRDILLQYGATSASLRDTVAALCRRLCNPITLWEDIRALVVGRLIVLDKCPAMRLIGIGKILCRIIGMTICLATRIDITVAVALINYVLAFLPVLRVLFTP